jgi:succinate dehydrogenase/fumarate reductase cytochrome b subunit
MPKRTLAAGQSKETHMMNVGFNGIWGLLILAADVWAVLNIAQSSASNEKKALWIVLVVVLPLLGLILWYFLGPRSGKA